MSTALPLLSAQPAFQPCGVRWGEDCMKTCKTWLQKERRLTHLQGRKIGRGIKLERAADFIGVPYSGHRAAADAQLAAEVLVAIERDRRARRARWLSAPDDCDCVHCRHREGGPPPPEEPPQPRAEALKERPDPPEEDLVLRVRTADGQVLEQPVRRSPADLDRLARRVAIEAARARRSPHLFRPLPLKVGGRTVRVVEVLGRQQDLGAGGGR